MEEKQGKRARRVREPGEVTLQVSTTFAVTRYDPVPVKLGGSMTLGEVVGYAVSQQVTERLADEDHRGDLIRVVVELPPEFYS